MANVTMDKVYCFPTTYRCIFE